MFKKVLNWFSGDIIKSVGDVIDDVHTSKEEKALLKEKILKLLSDKIMALKTIQSSIIATEARGNWLQRSWRPILMLMFGLVVVYSKFLAPAFNLPNTVLEPEFWTLLTTGIGGYVAGRSLEKLADKGALNLDFSRRNKD